MIESYVGTSGFSYAEWKGTFYPQELKSKDYLAFYARRFKTAEINNTFYRIPSRKTTQTWAGQVPDEFRFALKLSQRITHKKRLQDVDEEMDWFHTGTEPLGKKLGCLLVQLPPWFRCNLAVLEEFLVKYAAGTVPMAFEFRHDSWFGTDTYRLLKDHKSSLCVAESEKKDAVLEVTAPLVYLRLRRTPYSEQQLREWAGWIRAQTGTAFVFLKHEERAPEFARAMAELLGSGGS